ncbi:MAG: GyrI-like domain-containing protein [Bacteroides sp.]|nr:GyrI-like domain-containing protein [Bacteroides sp.]MCM1550131.1 GyrI-like domain-containing protein [Clostridium sp.]
MVFDYKKEYKEFYLPSKKPGIITVPFMNYIAVRGKGNPNEPEGEYKAALGMLYAIAFTIKMSYKGKHQIEGYFSYVVPPLEGLWLQESGKTGIDFSQKETFGWVSMIRIPDFVSKSDFAWAVQEATEKKKSDFSKVEFFTYEAGLCVQCMHLGSYDKEAETIEEMENYAVREGYVPDISTNRFHQEIYLSNPQRTAEERLRTVIRHPVKPVEN